MKHLVSLLQTVLLSFALVGCVSADRPAWFQTQGVTFTECGPTVAAMVASWSGHETNRFQARSESEQPLFWRYHQIQSVLNKRGINNEIRPVAIPEQGVLGIYHVDGIHFVVILNTGFNKVTVYDPLGSIHTTDASQFLQRVSLNTYIAVTGP